VLKGTRRDEDRALASQSQERITIMLYTIVVVLLVLWLLGVTTSYTIGGLIHILLVFAIISVLFRVIQGRNPLRG
jgi:uncharacterized Tic20 family protein